MFIFISKHFAKLEKLEEDSAKIIVWQNNKQNNNKKIQSDRRNNKEKFQVWTTLDLEDSRSSIAEWDMLPMES